MRKLVTSMRKTLYKPSDLKPGTLLKDLESGDLGFLVNRFDIMENWEEDPIWVWDMYWSGPSTDYENRHIPFIEEGILGLLNGGVWILIEKDA